MQSINSVNNSYAKQIHENNESNQWESHKAHSTAIQIISELLHNNVSTDTHPLFNSQISPEFNPIMPTPKLPPEDLRHRITDAVLDNKEKDLVNLLQIKSIKDVPFEGLTGVSLAFKQMVEKDMNEAMKVFLNSPIGKKIPLTGNISVSSVLDYASTNKKYDLLKVLLDSQQIKKLHSKGLFHPGKMLIRFTESRWLSGLKTLLTSSISDKIPLRGENSFETALAKALINDDMDAFKALLELKSFPDTGLFSLQGLVAEIITCKRPDLLKSIMAVERSKKLPLEGPLGLYGHVRTLIREVKEGEQSSSEAITKKKEMIKILFHALMQREDVPLEN